VEPVITHRAVVRRTLKVSPINILMRVLVLNDRAVQQVNYSMPVNGVERKVRTSTTPVPTGSYSSQPGERNR